MAAAASAGPGASGSVRGRFPGRPWVGRSGNRADRIRVPFHSAGRAAEIADPVQLRILELQLNMQRLARAFGRDTDSGEVGGGVMRGDIAVGGPGAVTVRARGGVT